jgi:AraC-like DNA-binding protein
MKIIQPAMKGFPGPPAGKSWRKKIFSWYPQGRQIVLLCKKHGESAMKRFFSRFLISYMLLSSALLVILIIGCFYIYNLSRNLSGSEGYSHLATQMEIFGNDLNRMSALTKSSGNYSAVVKAAGFSPPLRPPERYALEQARKELANSVSALSLDMIVDYGIVFQNGACITAYRIFDSAADCFGAFLKFPQGGFPGEAAGRNMPAGFSRTGRYYTPEQKDFNGIGFAGDMRLQYNSFQVNTVFFIIDTDLLFGKWITDDIAYVELYYQDRLLGSYGSFEEKAGYHRIEYRDLKGYRGAAYIPQSVVWGKIRPAIGFCVASIVFFLFTGLGLSVFFSQRHSKPVEQMGTDLEKTQGILEEQDRLLRAGMFERLLGGLVYTANEWEEARRMFPGFPKTWCLCLIRAERDSGSPETFVRAEVHLAAQFVLKSLEAPALVHYIGDEGAVIILPVCSAFPESESYGSLLTETAEFMRSRRQFPVYIAVSAAFSGIEQVSAAYRQTRQLLRLAGGQAGKKIFFMDDMEDKPDRFPLEFTDSQRFYELLLAGDFEHGSLMIRHAFDYFRDRGIVAESLIYHLFWSFEQVFIRFRAENVADRNLNFPLPLYNPQDSIEELTEKILLAALDACEYVKSSKARQEMRLAADLVSYIDKNIPNPMLNLSAVSSHFGLSDRRIQNLIHKSAAKTFFEYVNEKRMKTAYTLLSESAIPVNDIGARCGFSLPNSFYKAFKRYFGFPPRELRKNALPEN